MFLAETIDQDLVYTASLPGLLRTVLIIVAVFVVLRMINKMMSGQNQQKNTSEEMRREYERQREEADAAKRTIRNDGNTRVEYRKGNSKDDGEYVDYEEVD